MKILKNLFYLILGLVSYSIYGVNSQKSYQGFVKAYSFTNGLTNMFLEKMIKTFFYIKSIFSVKKIKYENDSNFNFNENIDHVLQSIKNKSYYKFREKLNSDKINDILSYIESIEGYKNGNKELLFKQINNNEDIKFINFFEKDLIKNKSIQELITSNTFVEIAKKYFGCDPIFSNVGISISYPIEKASSDFAQKYHFDLDRIKWLKFFIYLSDVDEFSGPHKYIEGTHLPLSKPYKLVKNGYVRIEDEELFQYIDKKKENTIIDKKGTVFVGDTSAFHKGQNPTKKKRILLSIEYCNSLFGAQVEKISFKNQEFEKLNIIKNFQNRSLFKRISFF